MFKLLGVGQLTDLEVWTLFLVGVALSLIVGWLTDLLTGRIGFGVFGNAIVCILGIMVSLVLFRTYVGEMTAPRLPMIVGVAAASVTVHMFVLIFLRRALKL